MGTRQRQTQIDRRVFLGVLGGSGLAAVAAFRLFADGSPAPATPAAATGGARRGPGGGATTGTGATAGTAAASGQGGDVHNVVEITTEGGSRVIRSNGIPQHPLDPDFTYRFGVNEQSYEWRVPLQPQEASALTEVVTGQKFGVSVEGVPYDPATAGFWKGDPTSAWLEDAHRFPLDVYGAHVQPGGRYHYHEYPAQWDLVASLDGTAHGPQLGWAADGYPIYARYGYTDPNDPSGGVRELRSSWRLRSGMRPAGAPEGTYDGTWVQDYEYVEGLGDLDRCNGRRCATPDHPEGTYAYFVTTRWPFVPRWIHGVPDASFAPGAARGRGRPGRAPAGSA